MGLIVAAIVSVIIGILWGYRIDDMKQNHPEYKGRDFLDWEDSHTEGEF